MSKQPKSCNVCVHYSEHQCLDTEGKPILKYQHDGNQYVKLDEPYWTYAECKKNWGLPQVAYTSADSCKYYKAKEIK